MDRAVGWYHHFHLWPATRQRWPAKAGWLTALTQHRLGGLLSGTLLAAVLQSNTATVLMLVGFANAGLLSLPQAMSLLLGAGIGTTLVVRVMSFHLSHVAILIVVIGFATTSLAKRGRMRAVGRTVLGFGLVFPGIQITTQATSPLQQIRCSYR